MWRRGRPNHVPLFILILLFLAGWYLYRQWSASPANTPVVNKSPKTRAAGDYLFCFWNVENLFDDQEDRQLEGFDRELDRWFATNPGVLQQKLNRLSHALLDLNGGAGPDIIALVEVEGFRAADLLRQALNDRMADAGRWYQQVVMRDSKGLRHISPAILTRLPVDGSRTRIIGRGQRILETRVDVDGQALTIVVCHWTSRKTDKDGAARGRYADQVYNAYHAEWQQDPAADWLICGDFNDTPQDASVTRRLHATGDRNEVLHSRGEPLLFNLMADRDPNRFGTHYFERLLIFDQIVVSPGMLDGSGWSCDPDSIEVIQSLARPNDRQHRPWAFGTERQRSPRGYSDHFPVTVRLNVNRQR